MIRVSNKGAGVTTVKPNVGVVLNGGNITLAQYASTTVQLVAADIWSPVSTPAPAATASGLTLVTTSTFSAVSSVSINNCFTSVYSNYRVICDLAGNANNVIVNGRLRASGTDNTSGNYYTQQIRGADASISGARTSAASAWDLGYGTAGVMVFDITDPQATQYTNTLGTAILNGSVPQIWSVFAHFNGTTAFDGITILVPSGTITGSIRVYSYQNS
jgi:hypothetical protein